MLLQNDNATVLPCFGFFFLLSLLMQLSCTLKGTKQNRKQFRLRLFSQAPSEIKAQSFKLFSHIQRQDSKKKYLDSAITS